MFGMTASTRALMLFAGGAVVGVCLGAATMIAFSSTSRAGMWVVARANVSVVPLPEPSCGWPVNSEML